MDHRYEFTSNAGDRWVFFAGESEVTPGSIWFDVRIGPVVAGTHVRRERLLELAAMLLAAAGHDDPIPTGEATESDFSALEAS